MNTYVGTVLLFISALLFGFSVSQTGWAAIIECPDSTSVCNGTTGDDLIYGNSTTYTIIHGKGGNDYIIGYQNAENYLWGDDGNDILVGGNKDDSLHGEKGNDKYVGGEGDDTIEEVTTIYDGLGTLVNNDDLISGGAGDDYINAGEGSDRIEGGPGMDFIFPNGFFRDFSFDRVNCGSGISDMVPIMYSGDPDIATNCEDVNDIDR